MKTNPPRANCTICPSAASQGCTMGSCGVGEWIPPLALTRRERAKQTARRGTLPVYTVQQLAQQCANRTGPGGNLTQVGGTARVAILGYVLDAPSNYTRFVTFTPRPRNSITVRISF
eukprot:g74481.t1